jgi:signal transduction histidine kinase
VFLAEAHPLKERPLKGAWLMLVDITDRVVTEQIRKDFVANASHELRTPLTLLQGYIETLRDGLITDREGSRRALEIMYKHSRRILRLVEDMLTVSKLESSSARLNLEPFDLRDCAEEVVEHLRPMIDRISVKVMIDIPEDQPLIIGDRFYFEQILINLVENAIKNNPRGSLKVTVSQRSTDAWHDIRVVDNGVGIPQSELPYIFKRFYRVERHHGTSVPGTGLGLSIVRRAVEAHQGTIEAHSVPGVETAFVMRFPIDAGRTMPPAEAAGKLPASSPEPVVVEV